MSILRSLWITPLRFWLILLIFNQLTLSAATVLIDFEGLPDSTSLTTQYPGLTFANATVITAGISLNEFEFPPHSGTNVAFDDGGPMSISFTTPALSFGGYFTYAETLTLLAFDSAGTQIDSAVSAFSNNEALSGIPGSSPNEFLQVAFVGGISNATITGDPAGGSFVLDDVTYTPSGASPEPDSILLFLTGTAGLLAARRRLI